MTRYTSTSDMRSGAEVLHVYSYADAMRLFCGIRHRPYKTCSSPNRERLKFDVSGLYTSTGVFSDVQSLQNLLVEEGSCDVYVPCIVRHSEKDRRLQNPMLPQSQGPSLVECQYPRAPST